MRSMRTWLAWLALLLAGALLSACYLEWDDGGYLYWTPVLDDAPEIVDADARCYWDGYYGDYVWRFEALVDDWDGTYDVEDVWVEVYEPGLHGRYVDGFVLQRSADPDLWFGEWLEGSTALWCGADYVVDFIAEDWWGNSDVLTVWAVATGWAPSVLGH